MCPCVEATPPDKAPPCTWLRLELHWHRPLMRPHTCICGMHNVLHWCPQLLDQAHTLLHNRMHAGAVSPRSLAASVGRLVLCSQIRTWGLEGILPSWASTNKPFITVRSWKISVLCPVYIYPLPLSLSRSHSTNMNLPG